LTNTCGEDCSIKGEVLEESVIVITLCHGCAPASHNKQLKTSNARRIRLGNDSTFSSLQNIEFFSTRSFLLAERKEREREIHEKCKHLFYTFKHFIRQSLLLLLLL
jgi:hypothetical protein